MKGIEMYYTVKTLLDQGWSISGIARELRIDRKTVRKIRYGAKGVFVFCQKFFKGIWPCSRKP